MIVLAQDNEGYRSCQARLRESWGVGLPGKGLSFVDSSLHT